MNTLLKMIAIPMLLSSCPERAVQVEEGMVKGKVGVYTGNCMPDPNSPPCQPDPMTTTVFFTEPSDTFLEELLVDSVLTNELGEFELEMPVGDYSVFVRDGDQVVCTMHSCPDQCVCMPVTLTNDTTAKLEIKLDHATW